MTARLAAILAALAATGEPGEVEFRLSYISVHGRRVDTLNYDFDGDGTSDIMNTSIDFDKSPPERWLAIHHQKGGAFPSIPDRVWAVSDRACALVFGDYLPGGGVEVGFVAEDGVYVYPPGKETPLKLIHARTFFRNPSLRTLPLWSWAMDLDGNGTHDLMLPVAEGYRIYFQTAPGVFGRVATLEADLAPSAPGVLGVSAFAQRLEVVSAHFTSVLDLPRPDPVEINGDGLVDLAVFKGDTITCFLQKEPGVFPSQRPYRVTYQVPTLKQEIRKDHLSVAMVKFTDIDQDRLADLVVTKVEGTLGLWESIRTSIYLHMGTGRGNFVADKRIVIDGVSIDPEFIDMNLDGKLDAKTSRLRTDLMKQALNAFILGDVAISYEVFQFDPARGGFMTDPVYEKQVLVRKADLEKTGAGAVPLVFIRGDLTGDGRPDQLVVEPRTSELLIHPGRVQETGKGPRIGFAPSPSMRLRVDRLPKALALLDVNADGINDVLLYHSGALGLLLSRR